ncbi:MAG: acyl carrier protein [Paraglaciecola sp.]|jgi:acyl carrier protein
MSDLKSIKQSICRLIVDIAPEVNTDELDHNDDIRDELDLDSMDFIRLLEAIEKTLGVNIPESDYAKVNTLQNMAEYISSHG